MSQKNTGDPNLTAVGCLALGARVLILLVMIAGVLDCLVLFAVQFYEPLRTAAQDVHNPLRPLMSLLRDATVRDVSGVDVAPLVGAALIVFTRYVLDSLLTTGNPPPGKPAPAAAVAKVPAVAVASRPMGGAMSGEAAKRRRMELLREIAAQKRIIEKATGPEREAAIAAIKDYQEELTAQEKQLAFLSLDVVGSTKMKASEKELIIEHAFLAFRDWVDGIMSKHGLWKSSWTPDGVMAAFTDVNEAVASAQEVLKGLRQFNKEGHEMGVPFQLRLGVSQGPVIFDDTMRMDEVSNQVIDLAGHLQKYASPDSLLMAKQDHQKVRDRKGFRSSGRTVDGFDTLEWMP